MNIGDIVEIIDKKDGLYSMRGKIINKIGDKLEVKINNSSAIYVYEKDQLEVIIAACGDKIDPTPIDKAIDKATGTRDPDAYLKKQMNDNLRTIFG